MKSTVVCPIVNAKINENVARANAFFTVLFIITYLISNSYLILIFLIIDFALRTFQLNNYSLFCVGSKKLNSLFKIKPILINAGPKIFAAKVGLVFSFFIFAATLFEFQTVSIILASIFGLCAFLEAAFGFCVACQIYPLIYRFNSQFGTQRN